MKIQFNNFWVLRTQEMPDIILRPSRFTGWAGCLDNMETFHWKKKKKNKIKEKK